MWLVSEIKLLNFVFCRRVNKFAYSGKWSYLLEMLKKLRMYNAEYVILYITGVLSRCWASRMVEQGTFNCYFITFRVNKDYFGNILCFNEYYNSKLWIFKISLIFFLQRTTDPYPMILWNLLPYEKTVGFAINPLPSFQLV